MIKVEFTKDPEFVTKDLIEYSSRMRTFGLEKFNDACFLSSVCFYSSKGDLESHNAVGSLVVYLQEENVGRFLKLAGLKKFDEDDEEKVLERCGEFCQTIAEEVKSGLMSSGHGDLTLSEPLSRTNDIAEGIDFPYSEYSCYETSFYYWKEKVLVVGIAVSPTP